MHKKIITLLLTGILLMGNTMPVLAASAKNELSFVQLIGDVSEKNYTKAIQNYCKIPENVRESFQLDGWTLSISTEHLEDTWFAGGGYSAIASGYDDGLKEIRLENTTNGANAVIHEMGHYVDGKLGYISNSEEWKEIWEKEYTTKYGSSSPLEGFAESFEYTFNYRTDYQKTHPLSYAYIMNVCDQVVGLPEEK